MTHRIAFAGLGRMGLPMAANLRAAGHDVMGYDPADDAAAAARAGGVCIAESLEESARGADVIVTMLPNGQALADAYAQLLGTAQPGALAIDCSTVDVGDARAAHRAAGQAGIAAIDAPVSGGVAGACAGTLTFMVGGEADAIARARPILSAMGTNIVPCGAAGCGQAAKLANNMILGASMLAVCEAFVLGERLGVSHQALFDVTSASSGQCWALSNNCPVPGPVAGSPANNGYQPGFSAELMLKDLTLAAAAATDTGTPCSAGGVAMRAYRRYVTDGGAGSDFSGLIRWIRDHGEQVTEAP